MNGYKSVTYKYLHYPDGRVEKIQLSADSYATITKVVKVGTQKIETPVEPQTPAEPVEPQESPEIPPTSEPTPPAEPEMPEGV